MRAARRWRGRWVRPCHVGGADRTTDIMPGSSCVRRANQDPGIHLARLTLAQAGRGCATPSGLQIIGALPTASEKLARTSRDIRSRFVGRHAPRRALEHAWCPRVRLCSSSAPPRPRFLLGGATFSAGAAAVRIHATESPAASYKGNQSLSEQHSGAPPVLLGCRYVASQGLTRSLGSNSTGW